MIKFIFLIFIFLWNLMLYCQEDQSPNHRISAHRIENNRIVLDGRLHEEVWRDAETITKLIESEPDFGKTFSEKTIVKVLYDEDNIYVGAICYYLDLKDLVAHNLEHRDTDWDDKIYFILDTFHDHTKGYCFGTNALGAKDEGFVDGPGKYASDWDEVWQVETAIYDDHWSTEFQIPLRILRFPKGPSQVWGFNIYRALRKKNSRGYWTSIPPQHQITNLSLAGDLTG